MRNRYIVSYDITDDRRLRQVYKAMRGFGDHIQYSVFRCDLSARERIDMIAALHPLIDHEDDQVLVIDLGPVDGRAAHCVEAVGRVYTNPERHVVVIE
jgi:CRISPR-associated protein Cas2